MKRELLKLKKKNMKIKTNLCMQTRDKKAMVGTEEVEDGAVAHPGEEEAVAVKDHLFKTREKLINVV